MAVLPTVKRVLASLLGKLRIAWSFYQIVALIPSVYDANLPESIRNVLESVSLVTSLSFNLGTPLECQGLYGFLPTLIVWVIAPIAISLIVGLVGLAFAIRSGCTGFASRTEIRAAAQQVLIDAWLRSLPALLLMLFGTPSFNRDLSIVSMQSRCNFDAILVQSRCNLGAISGPVSASAPCAPLQCCTRQSLRWHSSRSNARSSTTASRT